MRTCLITGASGFIGRRLASALEQAHSPWQLRLASRQADLRHQGDQVTRHCVRGVDANTDWSALLQGVDVVVHAAARVHVLRDMSTDALAEYRHVNTEGTLRLAHQAAAAGVRRMVFLSTIGVHGSGAESPYRETDTPCPHSPYAQSKLEAELGLKALAARTDMEVVVVRPPLVYGPGAPGNFHRLSAIVRRGVPLPFGSVDNLRSLIGIDNLVDFLQCCMTHPAAAHQVFLVSDDHDLSTPALIRRMAAHLGQPARLLRVPLPVLRWGAACVGKQAMLHQLTGTLRADIHKARTVLNWTPPMSVDAGLTNALSDGTAS